MECEVEFYGMIAEKIGLEKTSIYIGENQNIRDIMMGIYPELTEMTFQIAVNNEFREELQTSENDNKIAILPPFAGG